MSSLYQIGRGKNGDKILSTACPQMMNFSERKQGNENKNGKKKTIEIGMDWDEGFFSQVHSEPEKIL